MTTTRENFGTYQYEIYLRGMAGETPDHPVTAEGWEALSRKTARPEAFDYVAGGSGSEDGVRENAEAFRRWRLVPRMLRDVSTRHTRRTICGTELAAPVMLAPVGVLGILHEQAERAVARAARAAGVGMVLSTASSTPMEDVATELDGSPAWYQLYWPRDEELAQSFLSRAETSGYGAVVVTLDTWLLGWRPRDLSHGYLPFLHGDGIANYVSDPVFRSRLPAPPEEDMKAAIMQWVQTFADPSTTWERLAWLREQTSLPILLKGVLHPDDARRARDSGVQGVVVSNHGGRQVDGAIGALDALPGVVEAAGGELEVVFDSGVRTGADACKALALGARAVMLGRPYAHALAAGGEAGVLAFLRSFLADLDLALALSGHPSVDDLGPGSLVRQPV